MSLVTCEGAKAVRLRGLKRTRRHELGGWWVKTAGAWARGVWGGMGGAACRGRGRRARAVTVPRVPPDPLAVSAVRSVSTLLSLRES